MTYTIIASDPERGEAGIALTTLSINVAAIAPFYSARGHVATTQAYANTALGPVLLKALDDGASAADAVVAAVAADGPNASFRQIAVAGPDGDMFCHTGQDCRPWAGHQAGDGFIAMGNVLAGPHVVEAMAEAFAGTKASMAERLLQALEAGKAAGGQADGESRHLRERSAAIRVVREDLFPVFDIRVDLHEDAVAEARRIADTMAAIAPFNALRGGDPHNTPALAEWEAANLSPGQVPSPFD